MTKEEIMLRDEALSLIKQHLKNRNLVKHCLAVEACMRAMAARLGEDEDKWGLAGLLHDLDYEMTEKSPERHTEETVRILEAKGLDDDLIHAVRAHAGMVPCETAMDWVIFSVDPLTGLIIAATLMHPERRLDRVDPGFIRRRYKEKSFARGARREDIEQISHVGLELDEFISICLQAMQGIRTDLGL
jgi:putative nucleotidyltransferase with HDIG domain